MLPAKANPATGDHGAQKETTSWWNVAENNRHARISKAKSRINLLDAFIERAEVRAFLWSHGEFTLHEAVDVLQADAERDGLIEQIGQDRIQKILAECFASYRYGEPDAEI